MRPSELLDSINQNIDKHLISYKKKQANAYSDYQLNKIIALLQQRIDSGDESFTLENIQEFADLIHPNDELTKRTKLSYIYSKQAKHNIAITEIVNMLAEISNLNPMEVVYPQLKILPEGSSDNPCILSDDRRRLIDVIACFEEAKKNNGVFRHTSNLQGEAAILSENEKKRLLAFESKVKRYWQAIEKKSQLQTTQFSFGDMLRKLEVGLRSGASNDEVESNGYLQVVGFFDWFNQLDKEEKNKLLSFYEFENVYKELAIKLSSERKENTGKFCVLRIAGELNSLLHSQNEWLTNFPKKPISPNFLIELAQEEINEAKKALQTPEITKRNEVSIINRIAKIKDFHLYIEKQQWTTWFTAYLRQQQPFQLENATKRIEQINHFKCTRSEIRDIIKSIPENERLAFIHALPINDPEKVENYIKYFNYLPSHDLQTLLAEKKHLTASAKDIFHIVKRLPETDRIEYVEQFQQCITNTDELIEILKWIPNKDMLRFLGAHQDKFSNITDVIEVMDQLHRFEDKIYLLASQKEHIKNRGDLKKLLKQEIEGDYDYYYYNNTDNEDYRLICKLLAKAQLVDDLDELGSDERDSDELDSDERDSDETDSSCSYDLDDEFTNGYHLAKLLNHFDEDRHALVVRVFKYLIQTAPELEAVLEEISKEEDRIDIAKELHDRIRNGSELMSIIILLPNVEKLAYAQLCQHTIADGHQLAEVLELLNEADRPMFAENNRHCIKDDEQLSKVVNTLHTNDGLYLMSLVQPPKRKNNDSVLKVHSMFAEPTKQYHLRKMDAESSGFQAEESRSVEFRR